MQRIFIGIPIPAFIRKQIFILQGGVPGANWVPPENYHISLRFIGEVDETKKEDIAEALENIAFPAFKISLQGIGIFTQKEDPHHLWVKPTPEEPLIKLYRKIETLLTKELSIKAETRKYTPHLTIAKLKKEKKKKVGQFMQWHNLFKTSEFEVNEYTLFESHLTNIGPVYKALDIYELDHLE